MKPSLTSVILSAVALIMVTSTSSAQQPCAINNNVPGFPCIYTNVGPITKIDVTGAGEVYIGWANLPNSTVCHGNNNGWVYIPATANEAVKALAISLYFTKQQIRVDTSGCTGGYENVSSLYSPSG